MPTDRGHYIGQGAQVFPPPVSRWENHSPWSGGVGTMTIIEIDVDEISAETPAEWASVQPQTLMGKSNGETETLAVRGHCALGNRDAGLETLEDISDRTGEKENEGGKDRSGK